MTTFSDRRRLTRRRRRLDAPAMPVRVVKGIVLTVACAVVLIPFLGVVSTSIAPHAQVIGSGGFVLFPNGIDFSAYTSIFSGGVVTRSVGISVFVTLIGTGISLLTSTMLAYALSRPGTFAQKPLLFVVLLTLLFGPGLIPSYLVVKEVGLLNSLWSLIVPGAVSGFNVIVLRAFFMGIPQELIDSARIDGAGELQIFGRVVLPLSRAVLAVVGLFYAVGYWNAFFNAVLYINDNSKWPLQLVLRTYVVNNAQLGASDFGGSIANVPPQPSIQMAILVISVVPILVVYPFLQRHFAQGVLTGAVKG